MKTITLSQGSEDMAPWVEVEIMPGRFWFTYWFEVSYWDPVEKVWYHDIEKDGSVFGFWFAFKKAEEVLSEVWFERLQESKKNI
jgi:hypothetical protein